MTLHLSKCACPQLAMNSCKEDQVWFVLQVKRHFSTQSTLTMYQPWCFFSNSLVMWTKRVTWPIIEITSSCLALNRLLLLPCEWGVMKCCSCFWLSVQQYVNKLSIPLHWHIHCMFILNVLTYIGVHTTFHFLFRPISKVNTVYLIEKLLCWLAHSVVKRWKCEYLKWFVFQVDNETEIRKRDDLLFKDKTALSFAVEDNKVEDVISLLQEHAEVNREDSTGK